MFMAHGDWSYHIDGNVMYVALTGQFNIQGLHKFFQEIHTATNHLPKKIINHAVVNLADWELVTNDSKALAKQYFENMITKGYQKVDYLMPSNNLVKHVLSETWQGMDIEVNFYHSIKEFIMVNPNCKYAKNWMVTSESSSA